MTRALKAFADKIGSTIIAEGIEREAELTTLVTLGIEYGQGFLLARPAAGLPAVLPTQRKRPSIGLVAS
jgi:EAL domain-containing protein (putative c-di-GMP-specific phosphodiesterase class I)